MFVKDREGRYLLCNEAAARFSRHTVLEPKVVDLNALVHENEGMLRRLIGEDILLATVLDAAPKLVRVDPGEISQVMMNLAVNARESPLVFILRG